MHKQISTASAQSYFPNTSPFVLLPFILWVFFAKDPCPHPATVPLLLSFTLPTSASAVEEACLIALGNAFTIW